MAGGQSSATPMGFQPRPGMDLAAALKGKLPKQAEAYDPRTQMPLHDPAAMRRAKLDPSAPPSFFSRRFWRVSMVV